MRCLFFRYGKNEDRKNLFSNFIFDVSLGNERQASSENTVTWEGNQPRSRTVKRSSTDLTELADRRRATSQLRPELSALCEHAMDFNHTIDWEKSEILKVENNYSKRLISEAWYINAHPKVMNRSDGDSLPNVYRSLAK